ncbi:hypothetical protein H072_10464 [Dactylellina haptotyla CBS 200.50]|uniref:Phosphomevalonate kinase n=1 Tax=Dactylellina haptotyla (strain CBS 200.50) TaxID=1284197 RepID=S8BAF7_DACHA|nr:hypothetical protein H072_10464 [Dactylellina haptotyla CBS 200.50]
MATAVSAPGKVLLAGGYTVLDASCRGLVFALDARIHCITTTTSSADGGQQGAIVVRSPQFEDAVWHYRATDLGPGRGVDVVQTNSDADPNHFILTTLKYVLSYLALPAIPALALTVLAANSYYSQPPPPLPRFNALAVPIKSANKTGLGSSAALVTSLTASLIHHLSSSDSSTLQRTLHNLAQAAHCAAQGKVGSGFDVAAATYGSCEYQRFPPSVLSAIPEPGSPTFVETLTATVNSQWDMTVSPVRLPAGINLVMGDVQCGSSTPGMVKTVLAWRKDAASSGGEDLWRRLDTRNRTLMTTISQLSSGDTTITPTARDQLASNINDIRETVRELGTNAGVEIEPASQTKLLDAAMAVEGVIGGVVPGAGGYDAVCILYLNQGDTGDKVRAFLEGYKLDNGFVKPLEAGQENEGVKKEDLGAYSDVLHYFDGGLV